jgi:alkylhydroperoxidase family enzyme
MGYLWSLPERAVLRDVFAAFPVTSRPLLEYHQALLRGPSPFSVAERELIAAYVSGLNACGYCHGVHTPPRRPSASTRAWWRRCWTTSTPRRSRSG